MNCTYLCVINWSSQHLSSNKTYHNTSIFILGVQPPPPLNTGNVVLLPPTATTAIPQGNAPIIVPNLSPPPVDSAHQFDVGVSSSNDGTPKTTTTVETPEFLNDQQMFNYVSSTLLKVLHDCEPLLGVSVINEILGKYVSCLFQLAKMF